MKKIKVNMKNKLMRQNIGREISYISIHVYILFSEEVCNLGDLSLNIE